MPAASSIYWNSEDSQRSSGDGSEPASSSSSSGPGRRRYVDPWDLENYAYLRRQQNQITIPRNEEAARPHNLSPQSNESTSDSYYWYPMTSAMRESGYDPATSIDELYLGPSRHMHHAKQYPMQEATYEDEARYVTPNPVYVPLSDLEYSEETEDHPAIKFVQKRRNKSFKNVAYLKDECPCPYHGPLPENGIAGDAGVTPPKQLGLNTYGHLRIDYAKSWNSLHRKMKK